MTRSRHRPSRLSIRCWLPGCRASRTGRVLPVARVRGSQQLERALHTHARPWAPHGQPVVEKRRSVESACSSLAVSRLSALTDLVADLLAPCGDCGRSCGLRTRYQPPSQPRAMGYERLPVQTRLKRREMRTDRSRSVSPNRSIATSTSRTLRVVSHTALCMRVMSAREGRSSRTSFSDQRLAADYGACFSE